jgi:hypothetical protein
VELDAPFVPDAVQDTGATKTGAGWTVDEKIGAYARVVAGPGDRNPHRIGSNTSDTFTFEDSGEWEENPTDESLIQIVEGVEEVTEGAAVVTAIPLETQRRGYLVKLAADGTPYLDLADPISVPVASGIPLPPKSFLGDVGTIHAGRHTGILHLVRYVDRFSPGYTFAAYEQGEKLFLCGEARDWRDVTSIDVPYAPLPPDLETVDDYLLFPDKGRTALVESLAYYMARRARSLKVEIDVKEFAEEASSTQEILLNNIVGTGRPVVRRIQEGRW